MGNIEVQVHVTPEACREMIRYSTYYKFIYWLVMLLLSLMQVWYHVKARYDNSMIYNNHEKLIAANNVDMLFTFITIAILLLTFHYMWKYICVRILGGKLYKAYRKKDILNIYAEFNSSSCKFLLRHSNLDLRGKPTIYSTKNYYLFYYKTKYLREVSFFLPKHGDDEFKNKVEKIIKSCKANLKTPIKDKS
ncbi:hypothetical protein ACFVAD_22625 [Sutcliffiella sp. NPDC057660]|uniref:hypothetical protein n=1 Tax=Sutcliffiella sp. NPDC057660 TaxID=3346199 RepID=UPI0036C440CE